MNREANPTTSVPDHVGKELQPPTPQIAPQVVTPAFSGLGRNGSCSGAVSKPQNSGTTNKTTHHRGASQIPNGLEVAFLLASSRRLAQSEQTPSAWAVPPSRSAILQKGPFHLVQPVRSLFKLPHLPSEAVSSPDVLDKDTLFAQDSVDWRTPFALNQPPGMSK